jgi:hypothetical protein
MNLLASKITLPGLLFLFTLGSGFWLSRSGKPLNTIIFTIHKLIALATVVFTVSLMYGLLKTSDSKIAALTLMIISGLLVITLFVTGALLSTGKPANNLVLTAHKIMPYLAAVSTAATIYLLGVV